MRRLFLTIATALPLLLPATAFAMQSQIFEFAEGKVNASWTGKGPIEMQQQSDGILLRTGNGTGYFLTTGNTLIAPETVTITASAETPLRLGFHWMANGQQFQMPVYLPNGAQHNVSISPNANDKSQIGLMLPPYTAVYIHQIEAYQWNIFEKAVEAVMSFWTFDTYRPYSINFLWGPQIGFNPLERAQLYAQLPPVYRSGMQTMLSVLLIVFILFIVISFVRIKHNKKKWIVSSFSIVLLATWLMLDIRMGSEFLSYVWTDHSSYIAADETTRTFRERERFYDFAEAAAPLVADRATYIFFAEQPWPYLGNVRYITYPAIPGFDLDNDDTWVVYGRPDITVDANGQIVAEGEALSLPGKVLLQFDETSFVFRTNQ